MSDRDGGDRQDGGVDREYGRPGNYYIMEGTWVRAPQSPMRELGVISEIQEHGPKSPREGSVTILWHPNSSGHLSMMSLRHNLRTRRLVVDDSQHPYDKVAWETDPAEVKRRVE